jgi:hypothetical protein
VKVAFDGVGLMVRGALVALGCEIVPRHEGESVDAWVERAAADGASMVVSSARSAGKAAYQRALYWIKVPGHIGGDEQVRLTLRKIARVLREVAEDNAAILEAPAFVGTVDEFERWLVANG